MSIDVYPPCCDGGGGGGTDLEIQDEGITVETQTSLINFVGAGVVASQTAAGQVEVEIPGGTQSPLTTKGDIWGFDTDDNRVPVGTDNFVLTADSSEALGIKWGPMPAQQPIYVYFA